MESSVISERISGMSTEQCERAWRQTVERYYSLIPPEMMNAVASRDMTPRYALAQFAKFANGDGKFSVAKIQRQRKLSKFVNAGFINLCHRAGILFQVQPSELTDSHKSKRVVIARMFVVAVCHDHQGMTYKDIAEAMRGSRDKHATVIHAHHRLRDAMTMGETWMVWGGYQFVKMTGSEILARLKVQSETEAA